MQRPLVDRAKQHLAHLVDHAFTQTALNPPALLRMRSSSEGLGHEGRMRGLGVVQRFYNRPEFLTAESEFFPRPARITPEIRRVRRLGDEGEVLDLSWPSHFEPLWSNDAAVELLEKHGVLEEATHGETLDPVARPSKSQRVLRDKYLSVVRNRTAHARWFRHRDGPRPCAVMLHGYMSGSFLVEERTWPLGQLFAGGMDVVLSVLPFHGRRRDERRGFLPPAFPSNDPRYTVEGFRQFVFDHAALFDYLLASDVSALGVMGMSLGGYSSALLATIERRLSFAVLFIALASIDQFAHQHGRMVGDAAQQAAQAEALRLALLPVDPRARAPVLPRDRVVVIAGEADRVTGIDHAQKLAGHFGADLVTFSGGHLLQFGRGRAFAPVFDMLARLGHFKPPR